MAIARCRRRVFELAKNGKLDAWVDQSHGLEGLEGVAPAIDYMLQGQHVGKVVLRIQSQTI